MNKLITVSYVQKIQFSVVEDGYGKQFCIKSPYQEEESKYDNSVYFKNIDVSIFALGSEISVYRNSLFFDKCLIKLDGPGGRDGVYPVADGFEKIKLAYDTNASFTVDSFETGDIVELCWNLNEEEKKEMEYWLSHEGMGGSIEEKDIPNEVIYYFISRICFGRKRKNVPFAFSLRILVING